MAVDIFSGMTNIDPRAQYQMEAARSARGDAEASVQDATPAAPPAAEPPPAPEAPPPSAPSGGGQPQGGSGGGQPALPPAPKFDVPAPPSPTGINPGAQAGTSPTAVQGLQASAETGGVQGSFGQAGTSNFSQRFGSQEPATWYRRQAGVGQGSPEFQSRLASMRGGAQAAGGDTGGAQAAINASLGESAGGRPQDEEWQRFMQAVQQQRFKQ